MLKKSNLFTRQAGDILNHWLQKYQNMPLLFLSSGGSALQILDHLDTNLFTDKVTISVIDERFSTDPKVNNFAQLASTNFYNQISKNNARIIDTRPRAPESQVDLANRFESELKNWVKNHPGGKIIATLGLGPDGHTSGILPFPENPDLFYKLFVDTDHWVVPYDAGAKSPYKLRVTTTIPFLQKIDHAVFYVCGEEKKPALKFVYEKSTDLASTPGHLVKLLPDVHLFTDIQIVKGLSHVFQPL